MRSSLALVCLGLLAWPIIAQAKDKVPAVEKDETAHHRALYQQINDQESAMTKITAQYKDEPTVWALTGYSQEGKVRKIVAKNGDDGEGVEEYYLENEKPLFVFSTYYQAGENGKRGARVEERLYFREGSVFKWLTTEKNAPVFHGEDYQATTERLSGNCEAFVAVLKNAAPMAKDKTKSAVKTLEGTFVGIEQGDYFHWTMRTKSGEERSFFVLRPDESVDKMVEKPEPYAGKKCRITWKTSTEDIPESGGKMEVDQILSVEWLK